MDILFSGEATWAAAGLGKILAAKPTIQGEVATGTDDRVLPFVRHQPTDDQLQHHVQHSGRETVQHGASQCDQTGPASTQQGIRNPLPDATLCDPVRSDAKRRARDSNPQPENRHLNSNQAASQFAYPPGRFQIRKGRFMIERRCGSATIFVRFNHKPSI